VQIIIAKGKHDMTLKVEDRGARTFIQLEYNLWLRVALSVATLTRFGSAQSNGTCGTKDATKVFFHDGDKATRLW
jgi:hypothetical protein